MTRSRKKPTCKDSPLEKAAMRSRLAELEAKLVAQFEKDKNERLRLHEAKLFAEYGLEAATDTLKVYASFNRHGPQAAIDALEKIKRISEELK